MAIPDEVKKSQQVLVQKDRILAQAQEEANRTLSIAREKKEQLLERDAIVQAAHDRAKQILAEAANTGEIAQQEADEYVMETLRKLEVELERSITQVRNGIMVIQNERKNNFQVENPQPPKE